MAADKLATGLTGCRFDRGPKKNPFRNENDIRRNTRSRSLLCVITVSQVAGIEPMRPRLSPRKCRRSATSGRVVLPSKPCRVEWSGESDLSGLEASGTDKKIHKKKPNGSSDPRAFRVGPSGGRSRAPDKLSASPTRPINGPLCVCGKIPLGVSLSSLIQFYRVLIGVRRVFIGLYSVLLGLSMR